MDYAHVRSEIATGDLLLFRGRHPISRVIQWRTKSVFSHVGIAVWVQIENTKRLGVLEAKEGWGVRLYPLSQCLEIGDHVDWFRVVDSSIDSTVAAGWAMEQWGKQYASLWQFIRSFGLFGLSKRLLDALRIPTKVDHDRWFCSCFAAQFLLAGGWHPDEDVDPSLTPPGDVALFPCLHRRGVLTLETGTHS